MDDAKKFPVYRFTVSYEDKDGEKREVDYAETMCSHELTDEECREKINQLMTPFMKDYPKAKDRHKNKITFSTARLPL
ncbi:MAG: hypothetical protein WCI51_15965, partial [Lentisphaerota bacterium]